MTKTRSNLKDALTVAGVLALVLVALPVAAFLGVFLRLPLLIAVALAVVVAGLVAALSPAFREWLNAEIDEGLTCNGLRLATGIAMSPNHSWARITTDETWVGADDMVQAILGPIEDVGLPPTGLHVERGEPLFSLRRADRAVAIRSPISGTVVVTNETLRRDPSLINQAPFTAGWAVRLRGDHPREDRRRLLRGKNARVWFRREVDRLLAAVAPDAVVGAALPDGGVFSHELYAQIDDKTWRHLSRSFFSLDEPSTPGQP